MIEPKIDDLLAQVDSKYTLVILAAKRAREINSYYNQLGEGRAEFIPPLVETGLRTNRSRSPSRRSPRARSTRSGRRAWASSSLPGPAARAAARMRAEMQGGRDVAAGGPTPLFRGRVLLGVTGGIAAYKACILTRLLTDAGALVQVVMTRSAERFVGPATFAALSGRRVYSDLWEEPGQVLHVRLAHEADVVVVAPATANVIAKLAFGIADDLLTSTLLEARAPVLLAPAMHTGMWEHAATQANVAALAERGVRIVGPVAGALAHGDEGMGRMSEPADIMAAVRDAVSPRRRPGRQADRRHRRSYLGADRSRPVPRQPVDGQDGVRCGR